MGGDVINAGRLVLYRAGLRVAKSELASG
ncbi:hypothetical protein HKBW3S03_01666, partial [Candidatus Hakubella thermalkaliphila]